MTTLSSHLLNAIDGSHARNIMVRIYQVDAPDTRTFVAEVATDKQGRFKLDLPESAITQQFEMEIQIGDCFRSNQQSEPNPVSEILIRFCTAPEQASQHIPVILSPHGYSVWWSGLS
ncbi:MAG: hydroxyisourate hydrolase [Pseudomonadota bacterium]